ncbi:MAG: 2,4-diaminopentanoate dehydrogenase [Patescibacteria group bacterium]
MEPVRVMVWGLGAMGGGIARLLAAKPGFALVAGADLDPAKIGRDLGEVVETAPLGVKVEADAALAISRARPDVAVIATDSFLRTVVPQIEAAVRAGCNVVSLAEEMAYPWVADAQAARRLDDLARERGVTVLGTGINPGFVLDTLIVALTGVCHDVRRIRAARVNDLSPYGPTVMRTQGVGTTPEEFAAGLNAGTIVGHIGFQQSAAMIAAAVGWRLDRVEEVREPIVARVRREARYVTVEPGRVAGCRHLAYGYRNGEVVLELEHPQQVAPSAEGVETGDYINIEGTPGVSLAIKPEIPGGLGTMAVAVNMIPRVIEARPGLLCMNDLPVPAAILD